MLYKTWKAYKIKLLNESVSRLTVVAVVVVVVVAAAAAAGDSDVVVLILISVCLLMVWFGRSIESCRQVYM